MILSIFKKRNNETPANVAVAVSLKGKTTNEIIDEIHENFYTEVDKLLASAKIMGSIETTKADLLEKSTRLKALGFSNSKEVKEADAELARMAQIELENKNKSHIIDAINYFSMKYPNYKFITEDSVKKICAKYNLVYGSIDKYIGDVPDKNLKHIEEFKVLDEDMPYFIDDLSFNMFSGGENLQKREIISVAAKKQKERAERELREAMSPDDHIQQMLYGMQGHRFSHFSNHFRTKEYNAPLEIAAPLKDFNMDEHEIKDFKLSKIEIPDPVVLKPVVFRNQKHYLIVTAWGQEASDELVVNQKFN